MGWAVTRPLPRTAPRQGVIRWLYVLTCVGSYRACNNHVRSVIPSWLNGRLEDLCFVGEAKRVEIVTYIPNTYLRKLHYIVMPSYSIRDYDGQHTCIPT